MVVLAHLLGWINLDKMFFTWLDYSMVLFYTFLSASKMALGQATPLTTHLAALLSAEVELSLFPL